MKVRKRSKGARVKPDLTLRKVRAAVSNGALLLRDNTDGRLAWTRRLRDLTADHVSDLGGKDMISASEMVLIRRAAMLCLQLEMMECNWAAKNDGEASPKQIEVYQRAVNTLKRCLETLGLKRRPRDVTPLDPLDYAKQYDRRRAEAVDAEEEVTA